MTARAIPFSAGQLPAAPPGCRLRSVSFRTCPGSDLTLRVARDVGGARCDDRGVPPDAWWVVSCRGLPDRAIRLSRGSHSLGCLLRRYGFQDASGCVNHRDATARYEDARKRLPAYDLRVPEHLRDATGVPQFYPNSGICWYAALCTSSFANPAMRELIASKLPEDMARLCRTCLVSRDDAQALRNRIWYDFSVGDNVEDPPEMDGRNGCSELTVLCAKLKIPMIRLEERGGHMVPMSATVHDRRSRSVHVRLPRSPEEDHILMLRYTDGDHHKKFPLLRRLVYGGVRYRLVGAFMGQRKCGHQIGMCWPTKDWRLSMIGDADWHKDGISPEYAYFEGPQWSDSATWWEAWRHLVHVTKFGPGTREFCNLSPHNERDDLLDVYRRARSVGSNSCDFLYLRA